MKSIVNLKAPFLALLCACASLSSLTAAQAVPLGGATDFAVLGGSTVTSTGPTMVTGELGVSPGTAITGFPPGTVSGGVIHSNDGVATQAHADAAAAFTQLGQQLATTNLSGQDLGGMTLLPGVYAFNTSAQLTGTLNLDTGGDPNAVYIFQVGTTLTTASNSQVLIPNGNPNNVFWQIGSSATLGIDAQFLGTILADQSITLTTGASLDGHALAINAAVTMDSNRITRSNAPPDLSISYTDGVTHIGPGGTLTYTLSLTNLSTVDATNASASATLPAIVAFTGSADGGAFANGLVTFANLTVPANSTLIVQFTGAIVTPLPAGTPTSYSSMATVSGDPALGSDPNPANNTATDINTLDLAPDLAICTLTDGMNCTAANGLLTYVMTICNAGNIGATGVVVRDTIPTGTTFVSADQGGTFANGVVTWPAFSLAGGGSQVSRTVTVRVNSPLAPGITSLTNTATITDDGSNGADMDLANNTISDVDCVLTAAVDLAVVKTVDVSAPIVLDTVVYTVVVTNNGPDTASSVSVNDPLPAGLTFGAATPSAGSYDAASGVWTVGALANAASARLTISAIVNAGAPASIDNTACASNVPEVDSNPANNCATVTVTPSCARRPVILSGPTATPSVALVGVVETFTIVVGDNGTGSSVVVSWNFGDGTAGSGATVQHTFGSPGVFTVHVTVVNACGGIGTSADVTLTVTATPVPALCSLFRANLNLARSGADSLVLLAEISLPASFPVAGQRILVQINNMTFSAVLDARGRYKDARSSIEVKPMVHNKLVVLRLKKSSLRSALLPNLPLNAKSTKLMNTPFLIQVGSQSFGDAFDMTYTVKRTSGVLSK